MLNRARCPTAQPSLPLTNATPFRLSVVEAEGASAPAEVKRSRVSRRLSTVRSMGVDRILKPTRYSANPTYTL